MGGWGDQVPQAEVPCYTARSLCPFTALTVPHLLDANRCLWSSRNLTPFLPFGEEARHYKIKQKRESGGGVRSILTPTFTSLICYRSNWAPYIDLGVTGWLALPSWVLSVVSLPHPRDKCILSK